MKSFLFVFFVLLFSFCIASDLGQSKFVNCAVSGKNAKYKVSGDEVAVGFIGLKGNILNNFFIGFNKDSEASMNVGFIDLDTSFLGEQKFEPSPAISFTFEDTENWRNTFTTIFNTLYYDVSEDKIDSKTILLLKKVEKLSDGYMRLNGNLRFNASNSPSGTGGKEEESCIKYAFLENKPKFPICPPEIAMTTQIKVSCDFDVVILVKPFGW